MSSYIGNHPSIELTYNTDRWDYINTGNPALDTDPSTIGATWLNSTTGEEFVCTDNTAGANEWTGCLGSSVPWNPSVLTLALWLDAADASTIDETAGAVAQWDDKSGNNRHAAQSVAADKPTSGSTTIGGLNAIDFDGTSETLEITDQPITGTTARSIFAVVYPDAFGSSGNGYLELSDNVGSAAGGGYGLCIESGLLYIRVNGNASWTSSLSTGAAAMQSLTWASGTVGDASVWDNGTALVQNSTTGATINTVSGSAWIASTPAQTGLFFNGKIGEIIILSSVTATATRQKIEGYLAWKWGLEGSLPGGHPYETEAP